MSQHAPQDKPTSHRTGLLDLPPEVRLQIYEYVFSGTRIWITGPIRLPRYRTRKRKREHDESYRGFGRISHGAWPAILMTCKLVRHEAFPICLAQATFCFPNCISLADVLSNLPSKVLSLIRHMHVHDLPVSLHNAHTNDRHLIAHSLKSMLTPDDPQNSRFTTLFTANLLPLFPQLKLDTLVIVEEYPFSSEDIANHVETLLWCSGWKRCFLIGSTPPHICGCVRHDWEHHVAPHLLSVIQELDVLELGGYEVTPLIDQVQFDPYSLQCFSMSAMEAPEDTWFFVGDPDKAKTVTQSSISDATIGVKPLFLILIHKAPEAKENATSRVPSWLKPYQEHGAQNWQMLRNQDRVATWMSQMYEWLH